MEKKALDALTGYATDLVGVYRHTAEALKRHEASTALDGVSGAKAVIRESITVLEGGIHTLEARITALGGSTSAVVKDAILSVTGFFTGLYGQVRSEAPSRMLRDDVTALQFCMTCTNMLHATALAQREQQTGEAMHRLQERFPRLIMQMGALIPQAVLRDLIADGHHGLDTDAPAKAVRSARDSWRFSDDPAA